MHSYDVRKYASLAIIIILFIIISFSIFQTITGASTSNFPEEKGYAYGFEKYSSWKDLNTSEAYIYEIRDNAAGKAYSLLSSGTVNKDRVFLSVDSDSGLQFSEIGYSLHSSYKNMYFVSPTKKQVYTLMTDRSNGYKQGIARPLADGSFEFIDLPQEIKDICFKIDYFDAATENDGNDRIAMFCKDSWEDTSYSFVTFKLDDSYNVFDFKSLNMLYDFKASFEDCQGIYDSDFDTNNGIFYFEDGNDIHEFFYNSNPIDYKKIYQANFYFGEYPFSGRVQKIIYIEPYVYTAQFEKSLLNSVTAYLKVWSSSPKGLTFLNQIEVPKANILLTPAVLSRSSISKVSDSLLSYSLSSTYIYDISNRESPQFAFELNPNAGYSPFGSAAVYPKYFVVFDRNSDCDSSNNKLCDGIYSFEVKKLMSSNYVSSFGKINFDADDLITLDASGSENVFGDLAYCPLSMSKCLNQSVEWECVNCEPNEILLVSSVSEWKKQYSVDSLRDYAFVLNYETEFFDSNSEVQSFSSSEYVYTDENMLNVDIIAKQNDQEKSVYLDGNIDFEIDFNCYGNCRVEWDFGDGTSKTVTGSPKVSHSYGSTNTYSVSAKISVGDLVQEISKDIYVVSRSDLESVLIEHPKDTSLNKEYIIGEGINFSYSFSNMDKIPSSLISQEWDFDGDGNVDSTAAILSYSYSNTGLYVVSLNISAGGYSKKVTDFISVFSLNITNAKVSVTTPKKDIYSTEDEIGFEFNFDSEGILPNEYKIVWDFGDGNIYIAEYDSIGVYIYEPKNKYSSRGIYNVTASFVYKGNSYGSASKTIYVANLSKFQNVKINTLPKKEYYLTDEEISFSPSYSVFDSIKWDFGDGSTSNEKEVTHSYSEEGNYQVSFNVSLSSINIYVLKPIYVLTREPKPVISGEIKNIDVPSKIKLSAEESFDADNEIVFAVWDFGIRTSPWGTIQESISGDTICSPADEVNDAPCECPSSRCSYDGEYNNKDLGNPCTCIDQSEYIYPNSIVESSNYEMPVFPTYNSTSDCSYEGFIDKDYCEITLILKDEDGNVGIAKENLTFSGKLNTKFYDAIACSSEYSGTYDCTGTEAEGNVEFSNAVTSCCCQKDEEYRNGSCQKIEESKALAKDILCKGVECPSSCSEGYELVEDDDNICCNYKCQINIDYLKSSSQCPISCEKGFEKVMTPESSCPFACVKESVEKKSLFSRWWFWIVIVLILLISGIITAFGVLKVKQDYKGEGGSESISKESGSTSSASSSNFSTNTFSKPKTFFNLRGKKIIYHRTKKY